MWGTKKTLACELCGNDFSFRDNKRNKNRKYCSGYCAKVSNGKKNKGRKASDKTKALLSKKNAGKNNPFYGKKHSAETKCKIGLKSKWEEKDFNYCNLSEKQMEVLDGMMLADGHLESSPTSARLTYGCKFKETLLDIKAEFPQMHFSEPWKSKDGCYFFKSSYYRDLHTERIRWYPQGSKIVPKDVKITPLSCYWWFVGDGYTQEKAIMLCTDSFDASEIQQLIDSLTAVGFDGRKTSRNRIRIKTKSSILFLGWITEDHYIAKQYAYKWEKIYEKSINNRNHRAGLKLSC